MDWLQTVWNWIAVKENQETLAFIGTAIGGVAGTMWAIYKFFKARTTDSPPTQSQQPPSLPGSGDTSSPPSTPSPSAPLDPVALCTNYLRLMASDKPGAVHLAEALPGWVDPARLPVLVPLRHFAASLTAASGAGTVGQIESFLYRRLDERAALRGLGAVLLQELHDPGGAGNL
jgi:hypothetical protein